MRVLILGLNWNPFLHPFFLIFSLFSHPRHVLRQNVRANFASLAEKANFGGGPSLQVSYSCHANPSGDILFVEHEMKQETGVIQRFINVFKYAYVFFSCFQIQISTVLEVTASRCMTAHARSPGPAPALP